MAIKFSKIKFGYASAEKEGAEEPLLLIDGYFDYAGIIEEAKEGSKFLFLGYKGSGKSAIAQHLILTSGGDYSFSVKSILLADFPYTDFKNIVSGDLETKYPTAWSWILLLYLFASFAQDEGSPNQQDQNFVKTVETLKSAGLLPLPSLQKVALVSSKRSIKLSLPGMFETAFEQSGQGQQTLQIPFLVERLKSIAQTFRSQGRHFLIIDGLDDVLTGSKVQYEALAGLIIEVDRLNQMFRVFGVPAKVILLCRTDLYERLPGANKNKIRQDSAVDLDWYHDPRQPHDSNLVKLVNLRAKLSDPSLIDVFDQYFPSHFDETEIERFLLDLTRHTPRDFVMLMKHIQSFGVGTRISRDQLLSGIRSYSFNYFLPEIKDELVGYVKGDDIELVMELIGSLRTREFHFDQLDVKAKTQARFSQLDLAPIIRAFFECSAIGNIHCNSSGMV